MREIVISDTCKLKIYASAQELTLSRYTKFQKYLLLEAGIGSTIESVVVHFEKLHSFIANKMQDDAMIEAENLHYNFYSILQEINYNSMAFVCLIHSINDEPIEDFSEEAIKVVLERLTEFGLTQGKVIYENDEVKKKS